MLCDLLAYTGIAGCPDSFFRHQSISWWANYFNLSMEEWGEAHEFDQFYLAAVLQEGRDGTDVFGMRLMWESVGDLSERLELFYPGLSRDSARFEAAFDTHVVPFKAASVRLSAFLSSLQPQKRSTPWTAIATDDSHAQVQNESSNNGDHKVSRSHCYSRFVSVLNGLSILSKTTKHIPGVRVELGGLAFTGFPDTDPITGWGIGK